MCGSQGARVWYLREVDEHEARHWPGLPLISAQLSRKYVSVAKYIVRKNYIAVGFPELRRSLGTIIPAGAFFPFVWNQLCTAAMKNAKPHVNHRHLNPFDLY